MELQFTLFSLSLMGGSLRSGSAVEQEGGSSTFPICLEFQFVGFILRKFHTY